MQSRFEKRILDSRPNRIMLVPPAPYRLHPMQLADIDAVLEIDRLGFPSPTKASMYRYELTENQLAHYQVLTVATDAGEETIIGYAGYWVIADETHVSSISVTPAWRRRGLGELLLLNLLFMANEQATQLATLEVREGNLAARALYKKYQFEQVGLRKGYYRDTGENAVLMTVAPLDAAYYQTLERNRAALFERLANQSAHPDG